jgi:tellurite resistance protein
VPLQHSSLFIGLQEAVAKINAAAYEIAARHTQANGWVQRVIYREIENRARLRGPAYWAEVFPGMSPEARADSRIRRMLTRATVASVAGAAGATSAELLPLLTESVASPIALPLGLLSVGAEMLYTTALQIDLAFDLASIYGVPFAADDVGEISTLLAAALGVELVSEPTRHDKPAAPGATKYWRVLRQMQRDDFARHLGNALLGQAFARNAVPIAGIVVSAVWNQIVLRRFARLVHTTIRRRLAIVNACRGMQLGDLKAARAILDGAFLIATADGDVGHQEALALATLIDSLSLPDRIAVQEASFTDDEEEWFERLPALDPSVHPMLMRVLVLVASASGSLGTAELRFLRRIARALRRELDLEAIDRVVAQVREGETLHHFDRLELALQGR